MTAGDGVPRPEVVAPGWCDEDKAVVVAIDGSERNRAAVAWAIGEAAAGHRPLDLVHVLDERRVPSPFHGLGTEDQHAWRLLDGVEAEVRELTPAAVIRKDVHLGPVATSLVDRSAHEAELVVGRRGFGRFLRLLIGSTSLKVAGLSHVPVIVVPDPWSADEHLHEPIVVGVDPRDIQPAVLHHAFAEARQRHVPLVAAHGRDVLAAPGDPSLPGVSSGDDLEHDDSRGMLQQALGPYQRAFPDVELSVVDRPGHPLAVLLDDAGPSQLLVLGRHGDRRLDGFQFGSVAHGVLHYADVPVAIVPPVR